jgi:hypothetical protein
MSNPMDFRDVIQAILPDGVIWNPVVDGDFDNLLKGIGGNTESTYDYLKLLASVRDPFLTLLLRDLEKEFGIVTDLRLTEEERRQALFAVIHAKPGTGSETDLETILQDAGLGVYVHQNNPPVDPALFIDTDFQMVAGGDLAFAGDPEAYAGYVGAGLIVNGENLFTSVLYDMEANGGFAFAGEPNAVAGYFINIEQTSVEYDIPVSSARWPYVFFIGGQAYGWIALKDWNMEQEGISNWTVAPKTLAEKDTSIKETGERSIRIKAENVNTDRQFVLPDQPDPSLVKSHGLRDVIGGFTYPDNWWQALVDGDMERSGVSLWTAGNSATLTKQTTSPFSGSQLLRIAYNGVANPYCYDSQAPFTIGQVYRVLGRARSDGTALPSAYHPIGTPVWTGTNSTDWQYFDITFTATATSWSIGTTLAAAGYVEFDHVAIFELPAFTDGNMEAAGVGAWSAGNSAILAKTTYDPRSGQQSLRVTYNGVANPYAYQNSLNTHLGANDFPYKVSGWARSLGGGSAPFVAIGGLTIWSGTLSTQWQYFEFTRLATAIDIRFGTTGVGSVQFDDIEISPVLGAVGTVTGTSFIETELGPAREFNGSSDFITGASHIGILGYELDDRFTLAAWIKMPPGNPTGSIISRSNGGGTVQWDWVVTVPGNVYFEWSGGNQSNGVAVNDGLLHHVAVVIDGAGSQHYLDGEKVGSAFNPSITKQAVATLFGAYNAGAGRFFDGIMIAPQIYSEAKDSQFIRDEYNRGIRSVFDGPYVEQLIDTDLMELPVDGFAWSDGVDAVPCVAILDPTDLKWKMVWIGSSLTALKQTISATVPNGIKGIRLYNKFSINGQVNFDDISIIDPHIDRADVPATMEGLLKRLVMKYKPLHSWAGLVVEYS